MRNPKNIGKRHALWARMDALAKKVDTVGKLKLLPEDDIAMILGCAGSAAHYWKVKHMKKLLEEDE